MCVCALKHACLVIFLCMSYDIVIKISKLTILFVTISISYIVKSIKMLCCGLSDFSECPIKLCEYRNGKAALDPRYRS